MSADKKYKRSEDAKADLNQLMFSSSGEVKARDNVSIKNTTVNLMQIVFCPFCLHHDKLQKFIVSTKTGLSSKGCCPKCNNGMMLRNLLREWTPESYADWVFNYARSGFWSKISFAEWKEKLSAMGWSEDFWVKYKMLKAEAAEEYPAINKDDYFTEEAY